ncbi:MAG: IPTL-CTERM sorting domain-containing protein [Acidobacteriota bacterium]
MQELSWIRRSLWTLIVCFALTLAAAAPVAAQPEFDKRFDPSTIGPNNETFLVFEINNGTGTPAEDLAFTDILPAGVTISTTPAIQNTCAGMVLAPAGGGTITFTDGRLGIGEDCEIRLLVTATADGVYSNVTSDLTSTLGNSGPAMADLTVNGTRMSIEKVFTPSTVPFGGRSTLTFTLTNNAGGNAFNVSFNDFLPLGLIVATPAVASTTCVASFTPTEGSDNFSFFSGILNAAETCTATVDVQVVGPPGIYENVSDLGTSTTGNFGFAAATLTVEGLDPLSLIKNFAETKVPPSALVDLEFTILNQNRTDSATGITFTDDLNAVIPGMVAEGLPLNDVCGLGSTISGTGLITLSGGNLPPAGSCVFTVPVRLPNSALPGTYTNTTSTITATVGASSEVGRAASDILIVEYEPVLTKTFLDTVVEAGAIVDVEFTVTNPSRKEIMTSIGFIDNMSLFLPGTTLVAPLVDPCSAGSSFSQIGLPQSEVGIQLTGGELGPETSCTFTAQLQIPPGTPAGSYLNETDAPTATVAFELVSGNPASDTLTVIAPPQLTKAFDPSTALPGALVDLDFSLTHSLNNTEPATALSFTDDLDAFLTGAVAVGLPLNDICGLGSQISGTSSLSFTGGSLNPGDTCDFTVQVQVPAAAALGTYTNTTSTLDATVGASSLTGLAASADLAINNVVFSKQFVPGSGIPGETVNLEFTIENLSPTDSITSIIFTDDVDAQFPGFAATTPLPTEPCGVGSSITGTSFLILINGQVDPASSCTFSVPMEIPGGTAPNDYPNTTSNLTYSIGGGGAAADPAAAVIQVVSPIEFTKEFTDDPVTPGSTATLEFTITNTSATEALTDLAFTDDLDAAATGLVAVGLPLNNICGAGSSISGTGLLTFADGSLAAGASCTFSVTVQVPLGVSLGAPITNVTSDITGTAAGESQSAPPATADLEIIFTQLSKVFDSIGLIGGTVDLTFTLTNLSSTASIANLSFSDDLDAVIPGLAATGLPMMDVCGVGSVVDGTSIISFTGGSLDPSETCMFTVTVQIPALATEGVYTNVTSDVSSSGLLAALSAAADLEVAGPPTFTKAFAPTVIPAGGVSTLTFFIGNSANGLAATNLDFTDNLPIGVTVAATPNASTTCVGGTITAVAGAGSVSYTGGSVAANNDCNVQVDVTAVGGTYTNTSGDLTSSSGNSGTATADLSAVDSPTLTKTFSSSPVIPGGMVDVEYTVTNPSSFATLTDISFTDDLDAALTGLAASGLPTTDVCGVGSSLSGTGLLTLSAGTLGPGGSCTFSATLTVPGAAAGVYPSATSTVTATGAAISVTGAAASADLTVALLTSAKAFSPDRAVQGDNVTLTFTLTNPDPVNDATVTFTDDLDAVFTGLAAVGLPLTDFCGVGSSAAGTSLVTVTDAVVPAGGTCTFNITVAVPAGATPGTGTNVTSTVTSGALQLAAAATDDLEVVALPLFSKAFAPTDILAGGVSTLTLTIDNSATPFAAGSVDFTDNLPAGVVVAGTPNASTSCTGGTLTAGAGAGTITYTGGTVAASATCTVTVDVTAANPGLYTNLTGSLTTDFGDSGTATADLGVLGTLTLTKSFSNNPVLPGGAVDVEYTVTNPSTFATLTDITFTDDLGAALTGLAASGLPASDVCGAGSSLNGTTVLTLAAGTLGPGASCTFSATLNVPVDAAVGTYPGPTGAPSALGNGVALSGAPASADLTVEIITFTKTFTPEDANLGDILTLTFTFTNPDPFNDATGVSFIDDLDAVLPGLEAINLPLADVCGVGSSVTGTAVITFADGIIPAGGTCTFDVDVQIPERVTDFGIFTNFTSTVTALVDGNAVDFGPATVAVAEFTLSGSPVEIPTASQWGLILLGLLLTVFGIRRLRMN